MSFHTIGRFFIYRYLLFFESAKSRYTKDSRKQFIFKNIKQFLFLQVPTNYFTVELKDK